MKKVSVDTIGGRIRALRTESEMSIVEFAKTIDVTPHYLSTVELGGKLPSDSLIRRIAEALGVSRDYIKNGNDSLNTMDALVAGNVNSNTNLKPQFEYDIDIATLSKIAPELIPSDGTEKPIQFTDISESWINNGTDISSAIRELSKIYDTLQNVQQTQKLRDAIRDFMRTKNRICRRMTPDIRERKEFTFDDGTTFSADTRTIRVKAQDTIYRFQYLYLESVTKKQAKAILEQRADSEGILYLVFTNKQLWRDFCQYADEIFEEEVESLSHFTVIALILVDTARKDKWEIRSENEKYIDFEAMTGIPLADIVDDYEEY